MGTEENGKITLEDQFTHQNLADFTGMVRETISIVMEKLVAEGKVHYEENKIVIDRIDSLRAQLDPLV